MLPKGLSSVSNFPDIQLRSVKEVSDTLLGVFKDYRFLTWVFTCHACSIELSVLLRTWRF